MTREEARKAAEVMTAYADGKEIEFKIVGGQEWEKTDTPTFVWSSYDYRIKKEPTYRPFKDKEECWNEMLKHQPFGWIKEIEDGTYRPITSSISNNDIFFSNMLLAYTFADGTPFGIIEN